MATIIIRHRVNQYKTWKEAFDAFVDTRRAAGEKAFQIFHAEDDANNISVVFKWDNLENAHRFMVSSELQEAMGAAGVVEEPDIQFVQEVTSGVL